MAARPPFFVTSAALVLSAFAAACSSPTEVERLLDEAERAEARWRASRPDVYRAEERRSCECTPAMTGPVELLVSLNVSQGPLPREVVLEATYVDGGEPVAEENLPLFLTAEELFDLIREAAAEGADQLAAEFDPELGYPTLVSVDYERQIADDELAITFEVVGTPD